MSEVTVREAKADDLADLAAIEASGAETFAAAGMPLADGSPPEAPEIWSAALAAGTLWVAEDASAGVIGFLAAESVAGGLYIAEVDVVVERQRQGHGRRLMARAIDWARERDLADVTLTTFRDVPWNGPFYASMGFVEIPPRELPTRLAAVMREEASRGFDADQRCAMRLALKD